MTRVDRSFLFIAWIFGLTYVLITPPFQSPDEVHHLYRTAHISNGNLNATTLQNFRLGGAISGHYKSVSDPFFRLRYQRDEKISLQDITDVMRLKKREVDYQFLDFPNVGYYPAISYVPQSIILALLSPLRWNGLIELYLLRMVSICLWIGVLFLSIRIAPHTKYMWLFLGTLPAALITHIGLTTDLVTNGMAFLCLALFIQFLRSKKTSQKAWVLFSVLIILLSYTRVVFAPFALLGLIIPINNFRSKRRYATLNIINFLIVIGIIVFQYFRLGDMFITYDDYAILFRDGKQLNPGVNPGEQLRYIVQNPVSFLGVLVISWWEIIPSTVAHYLGKFGWEANYLPLSILALLLISLLAYFSTMPLKISNRTKLFCAAIALFSCLAVSLVLYMQWEVVGASRITSLSGRYFVGIFPLFFISLSGIFSKKISIKYYIVTWIISWIVMLICILNRYWTF